MPSVFTQCTCTVVDKTFEPQAKKSVCVYSSPNISSSCFKFADALFMRCVLSRHSGNADYKTLRVTVATALWLPTCMCCAGLSILWCKFSNATQCRNYEVTVHLAFAYCSVY